MRTCGQGGRRAGIRVSKESQIFRTTATVVLLWLLPSVAQGASLKAIGGAAASAHSDLGQEVLQQTPGPGSLTVTAGAAASDAVEDGPDRWEMDAIMDAIGTARYGSLAGRAHAEARSAPANSFFLAGGQVSLILGYTDEAEVVSASLAPGTPVTLTFAMSLEASALHVVDGPSPNPDGTGAAARHEIALRDVDVIVQPAAEGALVVNSRGVSEASRTVELDTAVGHRIEIVAQLFVSAGVDIDHAVLGFTQGTADVLAEDTAELFYQPSGDVQLVSDSGHEYAVPEPSRRLLLLASLPVLLWARRRVRHA
jgi:hypothetical protein